MARSLSVPREIRDAMGSIADHYEKMSMLPSVVEGLSAAQRTPNRIAAEFSKRSQIPAVDARHIVQQVLSFQQLGSTLGMSPKDIFEAITASLEGQQPDEWKKKYLPRWMEARTAIEEASSPSSPLYLVQKNIRLKYEHRNILHSCSIVTDIRPVFDEPGRTLEQMNVDYLLHAEYSDGSDRLHFYVTLDVHDLERLKGQCERAQTKTATLLKSLACVNKPLVVTGETDDE